MHRIIVALLAAFDAAIAVAVGLAATLAPLTLLWVSGFGGGADWGVLWPAGAAVWQLGNLVPLEVTLPPEYLAATGIDAAAASFTLSLAPLAFAAFTAIFAARSGVRASRADAWITGVVSGTLVFTGLATAVALTSSAPVLAAAETWQAIVMPAAVFAVPGVIAAVVTEWCEAGSGFVARMRDRVEAAPHGWGAVPGLVVRGTAVVVVGLIGVGALAAAVALFARAGHIVALFQTGNADGIGATLLTLAQLAYLPTLAVWGLAFVAGPGFAVGEGTAVSPAGTQVGVLPGLPVLGAIPESTTTWLLLLALLPIALGAFAGWIVRSRLAHVAPADASLTDAAPDAHDDPIGARLTIAAGIAVLAGGAAALLAAVASGSLGPGRLVEFGPAPGPVALAVGLEVLLGAAILLASPRSRSSHDRSPHAVGEAAEERFEPTDAATIGAAAGSGAVSFGWTGAVADPAPEFRAFALEDSGPLEPEGTGEDRPARDQSPAVGADPADVPAGEALTEPIDLPDLSSLEPDGDADRPA